MGKSKKTVDLSSKPSKISDEQLQKLQEVVKNTNALQLEVGKIESQKHLYLHKLSELQADIRVLQEEFTKEYGTCDINVSDGTVNLKKDEQ